MRQSKTVTACFVLIAATSVAASSSAKAPADKQAPSPPPQQSTFRSGTNLVLVDVYPMKDGRILQNLEKSDFEILEDGKPQSVENFQFIKVEGRTPDAEKRDPNTQEEGNQLAADPKNRLFVLYLDQLGVSVEGAFRSRKPLIEMLNKVMAPNDLFGVMSQDMRPRDMVFGRKLLTTEDMLARNWPWGERESILNRPEEEALRICTTDPDTGKPLHVIDEGIEREMFQALRDRRREDALLTKLEDLVDYLGGIRETRTALMVFTEGWLLFGPNEALLAPLQRFSSYQNTPVVGLSQGRPTISSSDLRGSSAGCFAEVQRLANLMDRARYSELLRRAQRNNVVFYPVNPRGLVVFDFPINSDAAFAPANIQFDRVNRRDDALLEAAEKTGGVAVVKSNDLGKGLDRVSAQLEAYYVLGYYSTNGAFDGKYRQISVKLKVPGVQISARKGYTAPTAAEMANASKPKVVVPAEVAAAESAAADALGTLSRIRGSAELYGWGVESKPGELTLIAEVAGQLAEAGKWLAGADVQAIVTTGSGEMAGSGRAKLDPGVRGVAVRVPVTGEGPWHAQLRLKNGADVLETTAEVRPKSGASLIGEPIVFRGDPGGVQPARPVADFFFRRTERVHIEWATKGAIESHQARLLDRAGHVLPVNVTLAEQPGVIVADLVLGPLGPGDYMIELQVSGGGTSARQLVAIRVQNN
jgi:VWFA-related protein